MNDATTARDPEGQITTEVREHVLLITTHHIVADGWSVSIMMKEISALYDAYSRGRPSPLSAPEL